MVCVHCSLIYSILAVVLIFIWRRNAVQDGCKLLCVLLDKLDSSKEDFNKSIFLIILEGASAILLGGELYFFLAIQNILIWCLLLIWIAEPPNSDVVSGALDVVMFSCSTHYPYDNVASSAFVELYANILEFKLNFYRRCDLELSRKTPILLSILVCCMTMIPRIKKIKSLICVYRLYLVKYQVEFPPQKRGWNL